MELLVLKPVPEQESSASRFEVVVVVSEICTAEKSERSEICAAERFERSEIWAACVIFMSSSSEFSISTETFNCSPVKPDELSFRPKNI